MYLLSLRLPPSPWVGIKCSATAQYTVPSVSTQTMTPRRVGFLNCSAAPPRAEPAGPSVWCTMMFFQGWALATSPQGASQTIFKPGISGAPDDLAIAAMSCVCADAETENATAHAIARQRKCIAIEVPMDPPLAQLFPEDAMLGDQAVGGGRHFFGFGHERRRRTGLRHPREMLQAGVARGMAVSVVDGLEA